MFAGVSQYIELSFNPVEITEMLKVLKKDLKKSTHFIFGKIEIKFN